MSEAGLACLILSGGKNRRMGGEKKLFLQLDGQPFYRHLLSALEDAGPVRLSVEAEAPYRALGLPLVVDEIPEIGPLGGLYSGLRAAGEPALLVVPCDMPRLNRQDVAALLTAYRETGCAVFFSADGRLSPLPGIYPRSVLPLVTAQIEAGQNRLMDLIAQIPEVRTIPWPDRPRENVNSPDLLPAASL